MISLQVDVEYEALLASSSAEHNFPDFDENTHATTVYTTGTTGLPKGVYFSHRQLVIHTLAGTTAFSTLTEQGRPHRGDVYSRSPPSFMSTPGGPFITTMLGVKQVNSGCCAPETLLKLIEAEKATFSHCVPTLLHMLLKSPASADVDLRNLKVVIGGSALPKGLARAAYDRSIDVFTGMGCPRHAPS